MINFKNINMNKCNFTVVFTIAVYHIPVFVNLYEFIWLIFVAFIKC